MRKHLTILSLLFTFKQAAFAQKQVVTGYQSWAAYFNQARLNNHWGTFAELQWHSNENFFSGSSQYETAIGANYYASENTKITTAYSFINNYSTLNSKSITLPEHRLWEQVQWQNKYATTRLTQWVRLEQRFRKAVHNNAIGSYDFSNRIRYYLGGYQSLSKHPFGANTLALSVNDELYINFGNHIVYNYFDQNRLFIGFTYYPNTHDNIQFGYMNLFQQSEAGNKFKNYHIARVYYFHNLDLRKKSNQLNRQTYSTHDT